MKEVRAYMWNIKEKMLEKIFYESPIKKVFDKHLAKRRLIKPPSDRPDTKPFFGWERRSK